MNESSASARTIAIPRALWWFRQGPFWRAFFEALGCRVITNDPARPTLRRRDHTSPLVEESCLPMRLLLDRALALADQADALFVPRLLASDRRGILCPRISGVPDILRLVLEPRIPLLAPTFDAREGRRAVRRAWFELARALGASYLQARRALRAAAAAQQAFARDFETRLNRLPTRDVFDPAVPLDPDAPAAHGAPPPFRVALLGHPYIAYDWEANLDLIAKLRRLGAWIVPLESIPRRRIEAQVRRLEKPIYWTSGRDSLGAALHLLELQQAVNRTGNPSQTVAGIAHLTCFKCGVDGLLYDVVKWIMQRQEGVAFLSVALDGHDHELGLTTRLEAFAEIVQQRKRNRPQFET